MTAKLPPAMPSEAVARQIPLESRRVPLNRRITLKFQHREGFVSEYLANVSLKGMFIRAWVPEPPGRVFLFEVRVADRRRLIHGVGEVVWVREADESPLRPAGMGVRFLKLDDDSREVIEEMVQEQLRRGGTPFDPSVRPEDALTADDLFPDEDTAPVAVEPTQMAPRQAVLSEVIVDSRLAPGERRVMRRPRRVRQAWPWLVLTGLLAISALAVLLT